MSECIARDAAQQRPRDSPHDDALETLLYRPTDESAVTNAHALRENATLQLAYTPKLLASWVPQPSPCCAAASVAGALNALSGSDASDWTAADVLPYYSSMTQERVRRQKRIVQMQTQASDDELDRFVAHVQTELAIGVRPATQRIEPLRALASALTLLLLLHCVDDRRDRQSSRG